MGVIWQSVAGPVLLAAIGVANAAAAAYALLGNIHALGIVAIGLAVASHPTHALFGSG